MAKRFSLGVAVALIVFSFSPSPALAGNVLFETTQASYLQWNAILWGTGSETRVERFAISYRPSTDQEVCTVKLGLFKTGHPTDEVTLTVTGVGLSTTASVSGNQVAPPPLFSEAPAYTPFTFAPCLDLKANTDYFLALSRSQPDFHDAYFSQISNYIFYPQTKVYNFVPINGFWQENVGYEPAIRLEGPDPQKVPLLIIPGIAGSELSNGNDLIWADLLQMYLGISDNFVSDNLALDENGNSLKQIQAKKVIEAIFRVPFLDVMIFEDLKDDLIEVGYSQNQNLFFFPYDWRLNLDHSKDLLKTRIDEIKSQTGAEKVDIIAHSMGGLLAKDYINTYGKNSIDKLIFVGTPHLGAPKAARILLAGDNMGIYWLEPERIKEVAHNSPAVYELLPDNQYFNDFQGYLKKSNSSDLLNYQDSKTFLLGSNLNSNAMDLADSFQAKHLEDIDLSGINTYNIAGCGAGTESAYLFKSDDTSISKMGYTTGDKTVPLVSADYLNIPADHKFYLKNANHAEIPSQEHVIPAILNILSDQAVDPTGNLKSDQSACNFKGKELAWHSPVAVHIYDSRGRHAGPIDNDGVENNIPGVDYQIIGHDKFVFLPTDTGETYNIVGDGLASGSFDLLISQNENGTAGPTKVFNDVPILSSSKINFDISDSTQDSSIKVDYVGNGTAIQNVPVSAVITASASLDTVPPKTRATVSGQAINSGQYRGTIKITLAALDDNSGILVTKYTLDGQALTNYTGPISVTKEGPHVLNYYSIDKAGNDEEAQTLAFSLEAFNTGIVVSFDFQTEAFSFAPVGGTQPGLSFSCGLKSCLATDSSGHSTRLEFTARDHSRERFLDLEAVTFNGVRTVIAQQQFAVQLWQRADVFKNFEQDFLIKNEEKVTINYDNKKDRSAVLDKLSSDPPALKSLSGKHILQIFTNKGKIEYKII